MRSGRCCQGALQDISSIRTLSALSSCKSCVVSRPLAPKCFHSTERRGGKHVFWNTGHWSQHIPSSLAFSFSLVCIKAQEHHHHPVWMTHEKLRGARAVSRSPRNPNTPELERCYTLLQLWAAEAQAQEGGEARGHRVWVSSVLLAALGSFLRRAGGGAFLCVSLHKSWECLQYMDHGLANPARSDGDGGESEKSGARKPFLLDWISMWVQVDPVELDWISTGVQVDPGRIGPDQHVCAG